MTTIPDPEAQIQALASAWVREYSDWFCVHEKKWWRRHEMLGSWSMVGARDLAGQRVSEAATRLDLDKYQWVRSRARQPFTVKRVLDKAAPHITRPELPGPPVDVDPQMLEAFFRHQSQQYMKSLPGTRSTEGTA